MSTFYFAGGPNLFWGGGAWKEVSGLKKWNASPARHAHRDCTLLGIRRLAGDVPDSLASLDVSQGSKPHRGRHCPYGSSIPKGHLGRESVGHQ